MGLGRRRTLGAILAVAGGVLLAASGCNIAGPAFLLIHGPEKAEALYQLPPDKSMVVFVDDRASKLPSKAIRQRIAQTAERTLLDGGAVAKAEIISCTAIGPVASAERFSKPKSIAEVGAEVGAKVVVYATVDDFTISPDGQQFEPHVALRVKVVDTETKARLWPVQPQEWHVLELKRPVSASQLPRTMADRTAAEQDLADRAGKAIAQLFLKHIADPGSERIGSP